MPLFGHVYHHESLWKTIDLRYRDWAIASLLVHYSVDASDMFFTVESYELASRGFICLGGTGLMRATI